MWAQVAACGCLLSWPICNGTRARYAGACGHDFCKLCLNSWREQHQAIHDREPRELRCPLCRGVFASSPFDDIGAAWVAQSQQQQLWELRHADAATHTVLVPGLVYACNIFCCCLPFGPLDAAGVCLRLRDVIEALWPQQLAARREELSRLRAGSAVTAQRKRGTDARDEVHGAMLAGQHAAVWLAAALVLHCACTHANECSMRTSAPEEADTTCLHHTLMTSTAAALQSLQPSIFASLPHLPVGLVCDAAAAARTTLQLEAEAADVRRRGTRASRRRRQARRSNSVVQATHAGGTAFNLLASMPPPPARPPPASPAAAAAADAVGGSSPWIPAASVSPQPQVHASSNAWPHWAPDELRFTMGWFEPRHATSSRSCRRARRPRAPRLAAHS